MPASWLLPIFALSASLGATCGLFLEGAGTVMIVGGSLFVTFVIFARSRTELRLPLSALTLFVLFAGAASHRLAASERLSISPDDYRFAWEVYAEVKDGCRPSKTPCTFEAEIQSRRRFQNENGQENLEETRQRVRIYLSDGEWIPHTGDQFLAVGRYRPNQAAIHPYAFNAMAWSARQGIVASFQINDAPIFIGVKPSVFRWLDRLRVRAELDLLSYQRDEATGILIAMLSGTKGGLTDEVKARFAASGIAHVLAVSGMHLSLMTAALYFLLSKMLGRLRWVLLYFNAQAINASICIPVIVLYVIFTGAPASAVRAGIMAIAVLGPQLFSRRGSGVHALSFAVLIMLLMDPLTIVDVGFLLSVAATLALVLLAKEKVRLRRTEDIDLESDADSDDFASTLSSDDLPNRADSALEETLTPTNHISGVGRNRKPLWKQALTWTWTSIEISTVSTLATAPFLVWSFGGIPWASPIPNLIVVPPLSVIAMPASAIGVMTSGWLPWVSKFANYIAIYTTEACLWICRIGAPVFEQELLLGRPHLLGVIGWALIAIFSPWLNLHRRASWLALLAGALLVAGDWWERAPRAGQLEIHAIPVGQGDATWIRFPNGTSLLVDAGGTGIGNSRTGTRFVLPYLRAHGVQHVEVLVATHGDADHIMGIVELAPILRPREIWVGGIDLNRQAELALYLASKPLGAPYVSAHERYERAEIGDATITFLPSDRKDSSNDGSLVFLVEYEDFRALFTGDIEKDREAFLVDVVREDLSAHYLKIPHHGSRTSSTEGLLSAVSPVIGVIHAGAGNRHNLPREDVLDRYRARGVSLWRTDRGVSIVHASDGQRIWLLRRHRWLR